MATFGVQFGQSLVAVFGVASLMMLVLWAGLELVSICRRGASIPAVVMELVLGPVLGRVVPVRQLVGLVQIAPSRAPPGQWSVQRKKVCATPPLAV